ncbi:hypothetical protein DVH24_030573 [Malus domestica]|uniref:Uncharacterized protein n=1 Tax=Malus domestica TaxID=3750 RepID=A0A498K2U9_MALDO|nr:hypothetical protein DVH24_030573 [Malus domestica]
MEGTTSAGRGKQWLQSKEVKALLETRVMAAIKEEQSERTGVGSWWRIREMSSAALEGEDCCCGQGRGGCWGGGGGVGWGVRKRVEEEDGF